MKHRSLFIIIALIAFLSCKKFVEVGLPKTELVRQSVFLSDATAEAAMMGVYNRMVVSGEGYASGNPGSVTYLSGLSSDEFIAGFSFSNDQSTLEFSSNVLTSTNDFLPDNLWSAPYRDIYGVNSILEGLAQSSGVSPAKKKQLEGEAKFVRAFAYFYLVNLFGDVPLVLTTDYNTNSNIARTPKAQVYQQMINDLKDAQNSLPGDYSISGGERVRPNKWAATALLSRIYLYIGDWTNAETQSSAVINNPSQYNLVGNLDSVFLKNSKEAIWQLTRFNANTFEASLFIITTTPRRIILSPQLLNAFESSDLRKQNKWVKNVIISGVTYYFPYKYKVRSITPVQEYYMVLRLAEQYLVRAEARAQQGIISGAQADLNIIRTRSGLTNTSANDKTTLLSALEHENQVEFFAEWGHRWFDLKRTNRADAVLAPVKSAWQSTAQLYPIPKVQLDNDPLMTQNPGY